MTEPQSQRSATGKIAGIVIAILVVGTLFFYYPVLTREISILNGSDDTPTLTQTTPQLSSPAPIFTPAPAASPTPTHSNSPTTSSTTATTRSTPTTTHTPTQPPTFVTSTTTTTPPSTPTLTQRPQLQIYCDGSAVSGKNVTAPDTKLVEFALELINKDRTLMGIPPIKLNPNLIAQEHAEDMLKNAYVSHWDPSGLKPYMRYTLFCGHHSNSENVAAFFEAPVPDPFKALRELEFQMVYNDTAQKDAHRDTILGPNYNQVQIGVAYDPESGIYLVHEFETVYVNWTGTPPLTAKSEQSITIGGNFTSSDMAIDSISVYYDPSPTPEASSKLMTSPYDDGYGPGDYVGSVTQPGFIATRGVTIIASAWRQTGTSFVVSFTLDKAYKVEGNGIYTLYLFVTNGKSEPFSITNASIQITR